MVGVPLNISRAAVGPAVAALGCDDHHLRLLGPELLCCPSSFSVILGPKLMILNSMSVLCDLIQNRSITVSGYVAELKKPILNMPVQAGEDKRILFRSGLWVHLIVADRRP